MMRVSTIVGHTLWAPVYDGEPNPLLHLERRLMSALLKQLRPLRVVDVACGTGSWLIHFQRRGSDVFGIDACEPMLREARRNGTDHGRLVVAAAEHLPFRALVADLVLCSMALGYFHDLDQVFQEFSRVCRPGASVAVSDLHPAAIAAGWTRSFKREGHRYEIENRAHSLEEIARAAAAADLRKRRQVAGRIGDPEFPIFKSAGKEKLFSAVINTPALFLSLWEKPC
jgi:ubiquinone/menaquinone biosynthesis C-methylase UbiE